jgi:hypothetical protein
MWYKIFKALTLVLLLSCSGSSGISQQKGWISLFDGKTFDGWQINESPETFKIEDGAIVVNGNRAHVFYNGPVMNHDFKNFELKLKVMTTPGSNSGIFIHTRFQESGWPSKGYEIQVNNSQSDWRRTGSVYGVQDVKEVFVKDNEWYDMSISVQGKKITIKLNDRVINEYTEPENVERPKGNADKVLSSGTFALQGHDPKSKVLYKDIMVKIN